jgi:hypothetical protein
MRGESDRECRAKGGTVFAGKGSKALKAFHSTAPTTGAPDASLKRGGGPLFRKRGGRLPEAFKEHEGDPEYATGGAVSGAAAKPSLGRAGRRSGGGVGADLKPLTSADKPSKPKGHKLMGDGERTP